MAEIQHYPDRAAKGRTHRTTLLVPPFHFAPANDNRGPRDAWVKWAFLFVLAVGITAAWHYR